MYGGNSFKIAICSFDMPCALSSFVENSKQNHVRAPSECVGLCHFHKPMRQAEPQRSTVNRWNEFKKMTKRKYIVSTEERQNGLEWMKQSENAKKKKTNRLITGLDGLNALSLRRSHLVLSLFVCCLRFHSTLIEHLTWFYCNHLFFDVVFPARRVRVCIVCVISCRRF